MKRRRETDDDALQIYKTPDLFAALEFCQHGRLARNCKLYGCHLSGGPPSGGFVFDESDDDSTPTGPLTQNVGIQAVPTEQLTNDSAVAMPGKRKRTVLHQLNVKQPGAEEASRGNWDPKDIDHMLRRSLALALSAVGFDSASPEALESFRMHVEECKS
jgi:hypothetical protein